MKKLILALSILGVTAAQAQIDRSIRPEAGPAPKINIPESEVVKLDNGLTIIISENHKQPKVSFNLVLNSDPVSEGAKTGTSQLAGDLIMSGTSNRSKTELDNEVDYIGAFLNAGSNSIYMSCLTKHLNKGLDLMTDVMENANFPESEFNRVKKQYESALLSTQSSPDEMASNARMKALFPGGHPYGEVMTESSLASISREDVVAYYNKVYTPKGSYLVIVGDITKEKAVEIAKAKFASWTGETPIENVMDKGQFNTGNRVVFVEKPGAVQSVISVALPIDMEPGDPNQIKLSVMNKILGGGGFGTRLMQNLREDKAYTYGAYSSLNVNKEGSWLSAAGNFRNEVTDSAIVQFLYEFKRITEAQVTKEELSLNKMAMAGSFGRSLESPRTVARFAMNIFDYDLPKDYYQNYLEKLAAVSQEDVLDVAKKYVDPEGLVIIVVGSKDVLESIKKFDADGKIEMLDAFGNEVQDLSPADITKEELIQNYIYAITSTETEKSLKKKMKKIKTLKQVYVMTGDQLPGEVKMTQYYVAPDNEAVTVEMMGMTLQKSYFSGNAGGSSNMGQAGMTHTELTQDEIDEKKKTAGLFPEMKYVENGVNFELLGVNDNNGKPMYVVEVKSDSSVTTSYYDKTTFLKMKEESTSIVNGEANSSTATYSDYQDVYKGLKYPMTSTRTFGPMALSAKLTETVVNEKIEPSVFVK